MPAKWASRGQLLQVCLPFYPSKWGYGWERGAHAQRTTSVKVPGNAFLSRKQFVPCDTYSNPRQQIACCWATTTTRPVKCCSAPFYISISISISITISIASCNEKRCENTMDKKTMKHLSKYCWLHSKCIRTTNMHTYIHTYIVFFLSCLKINPVAATAAHGHAWFHPTALANLLTKPWTDHSAPRTRSLSLSRLHALASLGSSPNKIVLINWFTRRFNLALSTDWNKNNDKLRFRFFNCSLRRFCCCCCCRCLSVIYLALINFN